MKPYLTSENFVPLRHGLIEHVLDGRLSQRNYSVLNFIFQLADRTTGTLLSSATIIADMMHMPTSKMRTVMGELREKGYIYFEDRRGKRGPSYIFIEKYRVRLDKRCQDGVFIGEDRFFAQIKLSWIASKSDEVISVSINNKRVSEEFEIKFSSEFQELFQYLDLYTQNDAVCRCLNKFKPEFPLQFENTLFRDTEEEIELLLKKKEKQSDKVNYKKGTAERPTAGSDNCRSTSVAIDSEKEELRGLNEQLILQYGRGAGGEPKFEVGKFFGNWFKKGALTPVIIHALKRIQTASPEDPWAYGAQVIMNEGFNDINANKSKRFERFSKEEMLGEFRKEKWL